MSLWHVDLASVPVTLFRSNSKFDQNSQCSGLKYGPPITTKFFTRHGSFTVVTKFVAIGWICYGQEHYKLSLNFEFDRNLSEDRVPVQYIKSADTGSACGIIWFFLSLKQDKSSTRNCHTRRSVRVHVYGVINKNWIYKIFCKSHIPCHTLCSKEFE